MRKCDCEQRGKLEGVAGSSTLLSVLEVKVFDGIASVDMMSDGDGEVILTLLWG